MNNPTERLKYNFPRGRIIAMEGINGAGKTTQAAALARWLNQQGIRSTTMREPGGTLLGEQVRRILRELTNEPDPVAALLLFCAARRQLLQESIRPTLRSGTWVVLDRYVNSTIAYQGYGEGVELELIRRINAQIVGPNAMPWLNILLLVPPEQAEQRAQERAKLDGPNSRYETRNKHFYAKVDQGYRLEMAADPEHWISIDGTRTISQVSRQLVLEIENRLKLE